MILESDSDIDINLIENFILSEIPEETKLSENRPSNLSLNDIGDDGTRYIILIDMDAYYAQVEMKKHGLDVTKPMAV